MIKLELFSDFFFRFNDSLELVEIGSGVHSLIARLLSVPLLKEVMKHMKKHVLKEIGLFSSFYQHWIIAETKNNFNIQEQITLSF